MNNLEKPVDPFSNKIKPTNKYRTTTIQNRKIIQDKLIGGTLSKMSKY